MINLTKDSRGQIIVNAVEKASGLNVSIKLNLVSGLQKSDIGVDVYTLIGIFKLSDSYEEALQILDWNNPI